MGLRLRWWRGRHKARRGQDPVLFGAADPVRFQPQPTLPAQPVLPQQQTPRPAKEAVLVFRDGSEVHLDEGAADAFRRLAGNLTRPVPD